MCRFGRKHVPNEDYFLSRKRQILKNISAMIAHTGLWRFKVQCNLKFYTKNTDVISD